MVQCTKKKNPESAFGWWNVGTASKYPKALSGFFLFLYNHVYKRIKSIKITSIYADGLLNPCVYLQVIYSKHVY